MSAAAQPRELRMVDGLDAPTVATSTGKSVSESRTAGSTHAAAAAEAGFGCVDWYQYPADAGRPTLSH